MVMEHLEYILQEDIKQYRWQGTSLMYAYQSIQPFTNLTKLIQPQPWVDSAIILYH